MTILGSTESVYYPVMIKPSPSGFDEWIVEEGMPLNPSEGDLVTHEEWSSEFYLAGCDIHELPNEYLDGIEDITGKIHNEPDRVFAVVCPWGIQYVGLEFFTEDMLEESDDKF